MHDPWDDKCECFNCRPCLPTDHVEGDELENEDE